MLLAPLWLPPHDEGDDDNHDDGEYRRLDTMVCTNNGPAQSQCEFGSCD